MTLPSHLDIALSKPTADTAAKLPSYLELALAKSAAHVAAKSLMRQQVGAIVASPHGRVISRGYNRMRWWAPGPPDSALRSYSIHAEEDAIRKALSKHWATRGERSLALYVVRLGGRNHSALSLGSNESEWGLSAPCEGCERLIYEATSFASPIERVWYSTGVGNNIALMEVREE